MEDDQNTAHPLLRGGRKEKSFSHGFTKAQIQSLTAICEALIPSMPITALHVSSQRDPPPSPSLVSFYKASGSDYQVPDQVAELMVKRGLPDAVTLVSWVLWALSTRLGTLLLCGSTCLSLNFPFIRSFSEMPVEKREKVLMAWSRERSFFSALRLSFALFKIFCVYVFYSWTDVNSKNPSWEAIDYSPGPLKPPKNPPPKSFKDSIISTTTLTKESLVSTIKTKGITVTEDPSADLLTLECDAVVVGSGPGGSVAAAKLAKSGYQVLVLEKGLYFTPQDYSLLEGPSMDQMYESGGILSTTDAKVLITAGSTVGGGSAINWSACIKTPDKVLKQWSEDFSLSLFGSHNYRAAMEAVCKRLGVTEKCEKENFQNEVFRSGCERLGLKVEFVPRNSPEGHYCGQCGYGCRTGEKQGTQCTWLVDAAEAGALIFTGVKAKKFVMRENDGLERKESGKPWSRERDQRCVGVMAVTGCKVNQKGKKSSLRLMIKAKLSVSACGSLLTPPLLISSGLRNPNIGRNLRLHPVSMAWGYFPEQDCGESLRGKCYQGGIITSIHKLVLENQDHDSGVIIETPFLGPASFSAIFPWLSGSEMKEAMRRYARTVHIFVLVRDTGSGEVMKERKITYNLHRTDREKFKKGLRTALRILVAAGAVEVGTHRSDGQRIKTKGMRDEDFEEFLDGIEVFGGAYSGEEKWNLYTSAHQMGSCRMGADEEKSAVDERGESWEAEGLFVCDGSLMPTALGVNPMITVQSIAHCISDNMVEFLRDGEGGVSEAAMKHASEMVRKEI